MAELKPCPFCGGEAKHIESHVFGHGVACKKCGMKTDYWATVASATRAWNRRKGEW